MLDTKIRLDISKEFLKKYTSALVTGGAGFIGSHICEELVRMNVDVLCLDNLSAGKKKNIEFLQDYPNFKFINADVTDVDAVYKAVKGIDIIFHNAASKKNICLLDPKRDLDVNAGGTLNMLKAAHELGVKKFVHASTGSVYGEPIFFPQDENHPIQPISYYGVSKLAGDRYVYMYNILYGLNTTTLRYYHVYGNRQEYNEFGGVVSIFIKNLLHNERPTIFGDGTQMRSFTYVKDVVDANLLTAVSSQSIGEEYNCASGISVTINELCDAIIEKFGMSGEITPIYEDWMVGDVLKFDVANQKIKSLGLRFSKDFFGILDEVIDEMRRYIE